MNLKPNTLGAKTFKNNLLKTNALNTNDLKTKAIKTTTIPPQQIKLHNAALNVAQKYKKAEVDLIEILERLDRSKTFYHYGYNSLFQYASKALKLSEEVAYIYINVARKSKEVPQLKEEIRNGSITVSKAKRITAVLTQENQNHWLALAKKEPKHKLEKQVAMASPKLAVREKMIYVSKQNEIPEKVKLLNLKNGDEISANCKARVQLQVGVSEKLMLKIRRVQDVLSQKLKRPVSLEECLEQMASLYLDKNDPVEKAQRQMIRGKLQTAQNVQSAQKSYKAQGTVAGDSALKTDSALITEGTLKGVNSKAATAKPVNSKTTQQSRRLERNRRKPLPAIIKHSVYLKHQGQCAYRDSKGMQCRQRRFLEIHHRIPISLGGNDELENLTLLCSGHHKAQHL